MIKELGGGGFSKTFEVEDRLGVNPNVPGKLQVLKVLNLANFRKQSDREKVVELFEREVEVLKRLKHQGIPQVEQDAYFRFIPQNSQEFFYCLVMEKIEGQNLGKWLQQNQSITEQQAIDWLEQLVIILEHVHSLCLHRDIKPENIMLRPNGKLVLIDFGAVKAHTQTYIHQQQNNQIGTTIGSRGYWPQEQIDGKANKQSDFFALGRTFVHLLTNQLPSNLQEEARTGKLIWREQAAQVSPQLADLIDWLIEPHWKNRPKTTQDILQRLQGIKRTKRGSSSFWSSFPSLLSVCLNIILLLLLRQGIQPSDGLIWLIFVVVLIIAIPILYRILSLVFK
ncbi:MAG: serine/threonine protein kinase [Symploca sp. SIO2C1]|nr:serine/threonine protein kinase [Symploca sp. SIO2C1]